MTTRELTMIRKHAPRVFVLGNFVQACCWHVQRLPVAGETVEASALHVEPGGKGLNVAIGLRRLGAAVETLIGCGTDAAADGLLAMLAREGISAAHVHRLPGHSGWGAGLIAADGRNAIAVYPGANALLTAEHARRAQAELTAAQLVYGQFETSLAAVVEAFAMAHARGVMTVLNPSPWQAPPESVRQSTHTLIVNEVEAAHLLARPSPLHGPVIECAAEVRAALGAFTAAWPAAQRLLVTLGERGALGFERAGQGQSSQAAADWVGWHVPAKRVRAVDTVGAGDAFASAYCAAVLAGQSMPQALVWGNVCGAHVAAHAGVLDVLPGQAWLREVLHEAGSCPQPVALG